MYHGASAHLVLLIYGFLVVIIYVFKVMIFVPVSVLFVYDVSRFVLFSFIFWFFRSFSWFAADCCYWKYCLLDTLLMHISVDIWTSCVVVVFRCTRFFLVNAHVFVFVVCM